MSQSVPVLRYSLHTRGTGVALPTVARRFYLLQNVQTDSVAHQAFCSKGIKGSFPGLKRPKPEAGNTHVPLAAKLGIRIVILPFHIMPSWRANYSSD
jgi:hypothetical protein